MKHLPHGSGIIMAVPFGLAFWMVVLYLVGVI